MDKFLSRQEVCEKAIRMILVPMASMCRKDREETIELCKAHEINAAELIEIVHKRRTDI